MKDHQGYIVEYINKDGSRQRAIAIHNEQSNAYSDFGRAFLRLIDANGNYTLDENGKKVIAIKYWSHLIRIGFID